MIVILAGKKCLVAEDEGRSCWIAEGCTYACYRVLWLYSCRVIGAACKHCDRELQWVTRDSPRAMFAREYEGTCSIHSLYTRGLSFSTKDVSWLFLIENPISYQTRNIANLTKHSACFFYSKHFFQLTELKICFKLKFRNELIFQYWRATLFYKIIDAQFFISYNILIEKKYWKCILDEISIIKNWGPKIILFKPIFLVFWEKPWDR